MKYQVIGWLEHVSLPSFELNQIKAKIDTGAKTSALHAEDIEYITINNKQFVDFSVMQDDGKKRNVRVLFVGERRIKSSTGQVTVRPLVNVIIKMGSQEFDIELTLINRSQMKFKMIIGRDALHHRFIVDPAESYLLKD